MSSSESIGINRRKTISAVDSVDAAQIVTALGIPYVTRGWELRDLSLAGLPSELSPGPWHDHYVMAFSSLAQAREALPLLTREGVAKNLALVLMLPSTGNYSVDLRTPELAWGQLLSVTTFKDSGLHHVIQIKGSTWTSIYSFLSAIVGYAPNDLRQIPFQGLRLGVSDLASSVWAVGDSLARRIDVTIDQVLVPVVDRVDIVAREKSRPKRIEESDISISGCDRDLVDLPPIDPMVFSPSGFDPYPSGGTAALTPHGDGWIVSSEGTRVGTPFRVLNEHVIAALRAFQQVDVSRFKTGSSWQTARMLSQLASAGIPIKASRLDRRVSGLLGTGLSSMLEDLLPTGHTVSERESYSIDVRRAALMRFLPRPRLGALGLAGPVDRFEWPSVSIVLSTRRPGLIPQILQQISQQHYSNLETVLAVHGCMDLPPFAQSAISAFPGRIRVISIDAEVHFGDVLNQASVVASGELITKMDDDDWYSPMHISDLVLAREYSGAELVGSPVEFSYLEGLDITTRRSHGGEKFTDHVAGGTMLLSKQNLKQVGWWRPTKSAVDRALIDAMRASGARVYRTHGQNYVMHRRASGTGGHQHTWDADYSVFMRDLKEQWDGFVLPPQFRKSLKDGSKFERSNDYLSIFSREEVL